MSNPLSMLFGKSPIKQLQEHMSLVTDCTAELSDFFQAAISGDWPRAEAHYDSICSLENQADDLKRELRLQMPKGLFMPVSRSDVLELITVQDNIANRARDIAGLMLGREMEIPAPIREEMCLLVEGAIAVTRQALRLINELNELVETGFADREVDLVEEQIHELDDKERSTDVLERTIRHKLFAVEKDYHPLDMMFLYDIIQKVGGLANRARRVGGRLQTLVAR
ncbi:MAG: TIGR00153 family protein [Porticoccaceae bacterium]|nr:TIGR00153 family protein [Porticoccaceae bacterium]